MGFLYDRLVNPQAAGAPPLEPEAAPRPAGRAAAQGGARRRATDTTRPARGPHPPHRGGAGETRCALNADAGAEGRARGPAPSPEQDLAAASRAMLRVRADLIDRLVNEAGEVSIARSRIEGDMRGIKSALFDLTENVNRLRAQLREIEIQAEGQMQSRVALAQEQDKTFDPLEFDRFTRFQEITRMMAESVNDVSTVQQNLLKALGESEIALSAQARLTRGLQANLMRIRMVPFASISERLFRIVRQAAKETDKRAVLDIKGGQVEVDRSVLERITAPFEHMLRNSVAHGIEPSAERVAKGKPELGEIKIEVRQEGNEIVLAVTDDGAGLNYERIRAKAVSPGSAQGRGHALGRRGRRVHLPSRLLDRCGGDAARRPRRRHGRGEERGRGARRPGRAHDRDRARDEVHDLPAAHARGDAGGAGARRRRERSRSPRSWSSRCGRSRRKSSRHSRPRARRSGRTAATRSATCRGCSATATSSPRSAGSPR